MIDPRTKETGEDKQDYCRRRGWGGGWKPGPLKQWKWWPNTASLGRWAMMGMVVANGDQLRMLRELPMGISLGTSQLDTKDIRILVPSGLT